MGIRQIGFYGKDSNLVMDVSMKTFLEEIAETVSVI
jgi:hypothetical protein